MKKLINSILAIVLLLSTQTIAQRPYQVLYADVFREDGKEFLHFKWRVDFSSYKKALITNTKGEVVGEVKYPKNTF
ncbi:MAG: hypothetical protein ABFS12_14345, partial [Bacteroidota bacterium]